MGRTAVPVGGGGETRAGVSRQEEDNARGEGRDNTRAEAPVGTGVPQAPFEWLHLMGAGNRAHS